MKLDLKKALLAGTAILAVTTFGVQAQATEITDGSTLTANDATGLQETTDVATTTVTLNANGGTITFGAQGTTSVSINDPGQLLTVIVDSANGAGTVVFADNITETAGDIAINIVDSNVTFQGNVSTSPITVGSGLADPTVGLLVDTANAENITFAGSIAAVDAADTVNLTVTNTVGGARLVNFTGAVGGSTAATAIDAIVVGANSVNALDVTFGGNVNAATIALGAVGSVSTNVVSFGTNAATSTVTGVISGAEAGDTNNIIVVGGSTVTFNSAFGTNLDAITIGANALTTNVTFNAGVAAVTSGIVIGGNASGTNNVTFNAATGPITITPAINGANAGNTNNLTFQGGNVTTVTGAIGAGGAGFIDSVVLTGTGSGLTTSGALTATTVTVGAGTTFTAGGAVTASGGVNITGAAGTVTLGDEIDVTGAINNTSGTAAVGILNIGDLTGNTASVISGAVGAANSLAAINITSTGIAQFDSTVNAATITISSTGTLDANAATTGNVNFTGDGFVTVNAGSAYGITGNINNTAGGAIGTLNLDSTGGTKTITGTVGATNAIKQINLAGTGTSAFTSTVRTADIDFSAAGTLTLADDTTVTNFIDFNNNAGIVTVADNADISGTFRSTGGANGTLNFTGSSAVTGAIGTVGIGLTAVNFNGGTGELVTVSGATIATTSTVAGAGSVAFNGDVTGNLAFTNAAGTATFGDTDEVSGNVTAGTDSFGNVVFLGDSAIGGTFGAEGNELASLTLSSTTPVSITAGGNFNAANTTTLGVNQINVTAGTVDVDAGQTLAFDITNGGAFGNILASGNAIVDAGTLVSVNVASDAFVADGATFALIESATAGGQVADLTAGNITDNSFVLSFSQVTANNNDLVLLASRATAESVGTTQNNVNVAEVLESLGTNGDATLDQIQANYNNADTQEGANDVLESLQPGIDNGVANAALSASALSLGINSDRLGSLRTGVGSGDMTKGVNTWAQVFGQYATQDARDGIDGYDADTYGVAVGADTENAFDRAILGVSLSYANSQIDSDNANSTESDVDSYQIALYGSYDIAPATYANVQLAYAWNDVDTTRYNVGGIGGLTANGGYDADQYSISTEVGHDFIVGKTLLTPSVSAGWTNFSSDNYTETGAGGASLEVESETLNRVDVGVGLDAAWDFQMDNGSKFTPTVGVGYSYDLIGDEIETTSSFTGGGAAFSTQGVDPARHTFDVNAGVTYYTTNKWAFTANYDYAVKEDYDAHAGILRAGYKF